MPDIFLSYNREDQPVARRYAEAFRAEGFDVWWDVGLQSGDAYDEVTEGALRASKAVVVLWSKRSVASRWVKSEATLADRTKKLVPAMIEPCERPIMFELVQTADLSGWKGDRADPAFQSFVGDVRRMVGADGARAAAAHAPAPKPGLSRRKMIGVGAGALVVVAAGASVALWPKGAAKRKDAATLAVLPFSNLGLDQANAFMADGLADQILSGLQRVQGLRVIARTSSFSLTDLKLSAQEIGQRLGADVLVQGSVQQAGQTIRVTASIIDAKSAEQRYSEQFQKTADDLFALQDAVTMALVAALPRAAGLNGLRIASAARAPMNPESYRAVLEATQLWAQTSNFQQVGRIAEGDVTLAKAVDIINAEIAKNPNNAAALAVKASIWIRSNGSPIVKATRQAAFVEGLALLAKAMAADPDNPDAAALQCELFSRFEYRWQEAEDIIKRSVEANPSHAESHTQYAYHLSKVGRALESMPHAEIGAQLDPLYFNRRLSVPRLMSIAGREDEAIATLRKLSFSGPEANFIAGRDLYYILAARGDAGGVRQVVKGLQAGPNVSEARKRQLDRMEAVAEGIEGKPARHRQMLDASLARPAADRFQSTDLWSFTIETAIIGDVDRALDLFQLCIDNQILYQAQWFPYGHSVPLELANHARWQAMWSADPRLKQLVDLRLQALQKKQFYGRMPDGTIIRPA